MLLGGSICSFRHDLDLEHRSCQSIIPPDRDIADTKAFLSVTTFRFHILQHVREVSITVLCCPEELLRRLCVCSWRHRDYNSLVIVRKPRILRVLTLDVPSADLVTFKGLDIGRLGAALRLIQRPIHDLDAHRAVGKSVWIRASRHHSSTCVGENGLQLWPDVEADDLVSCLVAR